MDRDRDPVAEVLRAIEAGTPVDWAALESEDSDDSLRLATRDLKVLSDIATFHRALHESAAPPSAEEPSQDVAAAVSGAWGPLSLLERIGQGSFGEVYRAWDRRLDREVAVKLLRRHEPSSATDSGIVHEGRLLARVRHPNVVTVYGADDVHGRAGIWMEFVRGRTLDALVGEHGPFDVATASSIGLAVCQALGAVHQAGLIHRDVKAQNVMREDGGRIVLMDFGTGREPDDGLAAVAGTPLYLAPELFEGGPATIQSDLYSVGVLLFHLVTGTYPIAGSSVREVREDHRQQRRVSVRDLRPDLPYAFASVVDRALSVESAQRFPDADAMVHALAAAEASPSRRRRVTALAVLAATAAVGVMLAGPRLRRPTDRPERSTPQAGAFLGRNAVNIHQLNIPRLLFAGQLSADGKYLPYSAESYDRLKLLHVSTGTTRDLLAGGSQRPGDGIVAEAVVSPDDTEVAYSWESRACRCVELRVVDAQGAANVSRVLVHGQSLAAMALADWSLDRSEILALLSRKDGTHDIALVSTLDGSVRMVKSGLAHEASLHLSPDGRHVVYDYPILADNDARDVFIVPTDGSGAESALVDGRSQDVNPTWTPDGRSVIFVSDRSGSLGLWLVPVVDGRRQGSPQLLRKDLGTIAARSLSRNGTLLYRLQSGAIDVYSARVAPDGTVAPDSVSQAATRYLGSNLDPEWSPDGRSLVYVSRRRSLGPRAQALVVRSIDTREERELWPDLAEFVQPRWSPDGESLLVWVADRLGVGGAWRVDARTGAVLFSYPPLTSGPIRHVQWAPDGRSFFGFSLRDFTHVWRVDASSGHARPVYTAPAGHTIQAFFAVSPDGHALAICLNEPGGQATRLEIVNISEGSGREVMRVGVPDLFSVQQWTRDGAQILITRARTEHMTGRAFGGAMELWSVPVDGGLPRSLNLKMDGLSGVRVSPDGERLAFRAGTPTSDWWLMDNFLAARAGTP